MVFFSKTNDFFQWIFGGLRFEAFFKFCLGGLMGLLLCAMLYYLHIYKKQESHSLKEVKGDFIILNMLTVSVLVIYTMFVCIQFKYLFSMQELPYGLNYAHYARRGFFEQFFLTFVNLGFIILTMYFNKSWQGWRLKVSKVFMVYLCLITFFMLVSSFYRMSLYINDGGYTRLRLLVVGFLCFEAVGLIATILYVIRPKFNIIALYLILAFSYYMVINVVSIDRMIAKDQVNRYLGGRRAGVEYALTLSADAAPEIVRLLEADDPQIVEQARQYFADIRREGQISPCWQRQNLSIQKAEQWQAH